MRDDGRLSPLRNANFRHFFWGETVNDAGSSMSNIALAFAVLHIDSSPSALGWVIAAWTVPMVAFMLIGGAVADRLPRALVLRGSNLIQGLTQTTTAVLVLTGHAQIWQLVVLQLVSGTASAVGYPAFHGMVPILLPEAERKAGFLLLGQSQSSVQIVGPAVAGVLVAASSPGWALAFDAVTYFVAAFFLTLLRLPAHDRPDRRDSVFADFSAGWGYARRLGWVLPIACCSLVYNALMAGAVVVLGPVIASETIGGDGWGFARAAQAVGLFAFAFVLARVTIRRPLLACQVGFVAWALPMLALTGWVHVATLCAAFFVAGCGSAIINLSWSLAVQEKVSEDMLSRVMAIDGFFSFVAMPIGQLVVGPVVLLVGARGVEGGAAALCLVTFVVACLLRPIRNLTLTGPSRVGA